MKKILIIMFTMLVYGNVQAQSLQWVKQIGGIYTDRALAITTDANGNTYTTGHVMDTVDLDPGVGVAKFVATFYGSAYIVKLDPAGNFVKAMMFGGSYYTHVAIGSSIVTDAANNIITAGFFYGNIDFDPDTSSTILNAYYNSVYVTKLDASGKLLWARGWPCNKSSGSHTETGPSMAVDAAGNIYTTGRFKDEVDFDPSTNEYKLPGKYEDGYISKLDAAGNFVWAKQLATDTVFSRVHPKSIAADATGNTYIAGLFQGTVDFDPDLNTTYNVTAKTLNGFLLKLDASGNFVWMKRLGNDNDTLFGSHQANAVVVDASGNAYTTGSFSGIVDFGTIQLTSSGNSDIFITKTDAAGNFIWAKQFGSMHDGEGGSTITLDAAGDVYTAGNFRGTVDFDPGSGVSNLSTQGYADNFVLKLTSSGNFVWAKRYGGIDSEEPVSCISATENNVFTVGKFYKTVNYDPNGDYSLTASYSGTGGYHTDAYIHKMSQNSTSIGEVQNNLKVKIYPNPTTNRFSIDLDETKLKSADVMVYDVQGRLVLQTIVTNQKKEVDVSNLTKGIYFVKIYSGNSFVASKLVIE